MKYLTVFLLGMAVLFNIIVAEYYSDNFNVWYHLTHKLQLVLVAMAGIFYVKNKINKHAFCAYTSIVVLNWIMFSLFKYNGGYEVTALAFLLSILFVNFLENK